MMKTSLLPIMFVLATVTAIGQNVNPIAARSYASTKDLVAKLESKDISVRKRVGNSLGIAGPINSFPCNDFNKVETRKASLVKGAESIVLLVWSDQCESIFLIPVVKERSAWVAYNAIGIWAKFSEPTIRFDSLVEPGVQEIITSNVTVDQGTGFWQRNMTILKFMQGGLRVIFDQPEYLHVSTPIYEAGIPVLFGDDETSEFAFSKCDGSVPGLQSIEEKRSIEIEKESAAEDSDFHEKKSVTVFRGYAWAPRLEIFRMIEEAPK
jgi:hypothetical protein